MLSVIVIAQSIAEAFVPTCFQNETLVLECVFDQCVFKNAFQVPNTFKNMFQNMSKNKGLIMGGIGECDTSPTGTLCLSAIAIDAIFNIAAGQRTSTSLIL